MTIIGFAILFIFFNSMYPGFISFKNYLFLVVFIVLVIYVVFKNFKNYKKSMEYLGPTYLIREIKREDNAKTRFYYFVVMYLEDVETCKIKLDILKSLTPISIVVFLLGILIDIEFSILGKRLASLINDVKNLNINAEQSIMLLAFALMFYYLNEYRNTWSAYKYNLGEYYALKYEYDIFEDCKTKSSTR